MNPANLPDDVYQRIITEAHEAHRSEIDTFHTLLERTKITADVILATDGFTRPSLQVILNAVLTHLEDQTIYKLFYEPALQTAQSSPQTKPRTSTANGALPKRQAQARTAQLKQSQEPMGFQARKK